MISLKKLFKAAFLSSLLVSQLISPISLISPAYKQVVHAATDDIPQGSPKIYSFTDEEDLKAKIFKDPEFIRQYALLAHKLGFGWCGGTRSQYVGDDFDFSKSGNDYILQAHYNANDPYASGYRSSERLRMTISNVKFYLDPTTLVTGPQKVSAFQPVVAGSADLVNEGDTEGTFENSLAYQLSTTNSHSSTFKFTEGISLKNKYKFSAGIMGTESEIQVNFSTDQGWTDTSQTSSTNTLTTKYTTKVSPRSQVHLELQALKTTADVPYTAKMYVDFTITYHGFLRYSDNARTDHPSNRPTIDLTFGKPGVKSATEDILDQYTHRDIPGYSNWDWNWLINKYGSDSVKSMLSMCKIPLGGLQTGTFHFDNATNMRIVARPATPISSNPMTINALDSTMPGSAPNSTSSTTLKNFVDNHVPGVKIIDFSTNGTSDPSSQIIPHSQMTATATSEETANQNNRASCAIDDNSSTIWHTKWDGSNPLPQSIILNLGGSQNVSQINYLPRQDGTHNGIITGYNVYVSNDGVNFTKVSTGTWADDTSEKTAKFTPTSAAYVKLEATSGVGGWASAAEINVYHN